MVCGTTPTTVLIMKPGFSWPTAPALETTALILEPLRVEHAEEMAPVLDDPDLHTFTGGEPANLEQLRQIYGIQVLERSPDGSELWFNWILRRKDTLEAAGYVQATITLHKTATVAEVAWVLARKHQGRRFARQAASALVDWLWAMGADRIVAHVHPQHLASNAIAVAVGLHPSTTRLDGDVNWTSEETRGDRS